MQSSELILWSDLVVCYASSIMVEAVCRDKPLIYVNYLKVIKKKYHGLINSDLLKKVEI